MKDSTHKRLECILEFVKKIEMRINSISLEDFICLLS